MLRKMYERSDKKKVWVYATALTTIVIAEIVFTLFIPEWKESFYNLLGEKNEAAFLPNIFYFLGLMLGLGASSGLKIWVGQLLSFELRKAGSKVLLKSWTKSSMQADNYSQAQTEGLRNATELYLSIIVEIVISATIVVALILANITNLPIVVAALIYTALVSLVAVMFNKPLMGTDIGWQEAEGKYREALGDIANGRGDFSSKSKFELVVVTYCKYVRTVMYYRMFSTFKGSMASIVPYLLLATPFFSGAITLGVFMAGVSTFELIVVNATILTVVYPTLTKARASYSISNRFLKDTER